MSLALSGTTLAEIENQKRPDQLKDQDEKVMSADHFMMKDGKLMMVKGGTATEVTEDMEFGDGGMVMKDGTYMTKADGPKMKITDGDTLTIDGKLRARNRIEMRAGTLNVFKGGETMEMKEEMTLENGAKVMTDGKVVMPDGEETKLEDGDSISMGGSIDKSPIANQLEKRPVDKN